MLPGSTCRSPTRPRERRCNVAVDNLQLGVIDLRLIGAHRAVELVDQRLLRVHLLLRDAARRNQRRVTVQIQLGVAQLRLIAE